MLSKSALNVSRVRVGRATSALKSSNESKTAFGAFCLLMTTKPRRPVVSSICAKALRASVAETSLTSTCPEETFREVATA
jgi:hypothetical protein